jgi:hypothetical protein
MSTLIAIPMKENSLTSEFVANFYRTATPIGVRATLMFYVRGSKDIGEVRQEIVEDALKHDYDRVLFIDSDIILTPHTFIKLFNSGKDMVTGVYYTKSEPSQPVIFKKTGDGCYVNYPKDEIVEIESAGLGCCLIKTEIFKTLRTKGEETFFKLNPISVKNFEGEDFFFFNLCKKHGIKLWCDTSLQVGHIDKDNNIYFQGGIMGDEKE